ncbi:MULTISPECIES: porin [Caballeronia]|uniref:porin n=1 Tax=Caballeronia TaxID=1827195 RepID=UPI0002388A50|nr:MULTISPECIES: porin [unclassified Caballeronia]AET90138.1 porin [Burkholderia sp. YI23]BAO87431.1 porin [Burkholderia sp. RPE67]BBP97362.1 porin [Burkholderia sp. SFA1]MCE4543714.1 porin [Caballeronia sp. PC1]MCE4567229.1 porin [Caballeronia sp. CLC5]
MKKSLLALAALGAFAGAAHAQSSVTLYGIIDAGFAYNNNSNGQKLYAMNSGNLQGSRWGLRGTEDLGGGLKAIFVLENGFNVFNGQLGQGGAEFGRQAYVGLGSQFGTVTLGRQYDSVVDFTGAFEVGSQWASYFGAHPGDLDNMNNSNRVNNAIKFTSANYAGFTFGGLYSLGGNAGQFNRNQIWSVGLGYSQGPLQLGAGYLNVKDPNYSFFGNTPNSRTATTAGATTSNFGSSRVINGYASAKTQQVISAGGAYTFGAATVGATYSNTQFKDLGSEPGTGLTPTGGFTGGTGKFHNAEINFKYQLTPALLLGVAYDYTKGYGLGDAKYHQAMLGADYFLSKRTDVYIDGVYQHASGTDSTNRTAVANINGLSPSSTSNQVAAVVGIRHKF